MATECYVAAGGPELSGITMNYMRVAEGHFFRILYRVEVQNLRLEVPGPVCTVSFVSV